MWPLASASTLQPFLLVVEEEQEVLEWAELRPAQGVELEKLVVEVAD